MRRVHFLCLPKENEPKEKAPLVLACGFTALRFLSGRLTKLAALTNLSRTNLDAGSARRVSGMDATNQTGKSLILTKSRYSSTQKGILSSASTAVPNALMRRRASQSWSDQHDGCLTVGSFRHARPDREAQGTRRASMGCPFVWFVYFGQAK